MSRQLTLPLETRAESESALKRAWARSGSRVPYQVAIHVPALAICLRNIAAAEIRRKIRRSARIRSIPEWSRWTRADADSAEFPLSS